jgi:hypothetical protein
MKAVVSTTIKKSLLRLALKDPPMPPYKASKSAGSGYQVIFLKSIQEGNFSWGVQGKKKVEGISEPLAFRVACECYPNYMHVQDLFFLFLNYSIKCCYSCDSGPHTKTILIPNTEPILDSHGCPYAKSILILDAEGIFDSHGHPYTKNSLIPDQNHP